MTEGSIMSLMNGMEQGLGPEYAVKQIFEKARRTAPCYLIFEDLDSIVTDRVRSYFLNEVDGLKANDGIFMLGSTNHLDQLDPGIAVGSFLVRCSGTILTCVVSVETPVSL